MPARSQTLFLFRYRWAYTLEKTTDTQAVSPNKSRPCLLVGVVARLSGFTFGLARNTFAGGVIVTDEFPASGWVLPRVFSVADCFRSADAQVPVQAGKDAERMSRDDLPNDKTAFRFAIFVWNPQGQDQCDHAKD